MATSPNGTPDDGVLRLKTNVPVTIALRFAEGLSVGSKFGGDQLMFSLEDGRKLFLSPFIARKMTAAGIKPGQPFTVCKCEVAQGNRRVIEYQFDLIEAGSCLRSEERSEPASGAGVTRGEITPPSFEQKLDTAINMLPAPEADPRGPQAVDGLNTTLGKRCLRAAIDVLVYGERYAKEKHNFELSFQSEDFRSLAISYLIGEQKQGGRS